MIFLLTLSVCISTTSTSTSGTTSSSYSTSCSTISSCSTSSSCTTSCSSWSRVASRGDLQAVGIGAARLITTLTAEQGGNNLFCTAKYLFKKLIGTISRSAASSPPRYFCYFQLKICSCRSHLREVFASFRNTRHLHVGGAPGPQRGLQQRGGGGGGEGVAAGEGAGGGGVVCHQEAGHQHQGREVVVGARLLRVVRLQTCTA